MPDKAVSAKEVTIKQLQQLRNVGPATAKELHSLGITTPEQMRQADPEQLYGELKAKKGGKLDRCVLYQFRGAILDVPWPECKDIKGKKSK